MSNIRYSCSVLMKLEFCSQIFEKYSSNKSHENPSIDNRAVPCGQMDRRTEVTKLTVAFRNFANAPTKQRQIRLKFDCRFRIPKSCQIQTETLLLTWDRDFRKIFVSLLD
jgi:hypothetical protein